MTTWPPEPENGAIIATTDLTQIYERDDDTAETENSNADDEHWYPRHRHDPDGPCRWTWVLDRARSEQLIRLHPGEFIA